LRIARCSSPDAYVVIEYFQHLHIGIVGKGEAVKLDALVLI
jgi:hypothetical protein